MAVIGETKIRFSRSYVYLNPDTSIPSPESARVGTWRLNGEEAGGDDPGPGPSPDGSLGFLASVEEPGGINAGQIVYTDDNGARLANASSFATSGVAGVAVTSGNQNDVITVTRNEVLDFYTVTQHVDGSPDFLVAGSNYYLSAVTAGNWTTTPDTTTPGAVVIQVGTAVGPNKMSIEIQPPIVI